MVGEADKDQTKTVDDTPSAKGTPQSMQLFARGHLPWVPAASATGTAKLAFNKAAAFDAE